MLARTFGNLEKTRDNCFNDYYCNIETKSIQMSWMANEVMYKSRSQCRLSVGNGGIGITLDSLPRVQHR